MPKPCPRCGLENTHEATHCSRCDAPLRNAATISPAFRRLLLALGGFALITTIGVAALVYVQQTAVPLGDPVVPAMDSAARDEAFAREQALEAPPPATAGGRAPSATGMAPDAASQAAPTPAPGVPAGPGATAAQGETPLPDPLDPLLGEEDVTAQMPEIPSGVEWNRQILPPTRAPLPPAVPGTAPATEGEYPAGGDPAIFPESNPLSSAPPEAPIADPGPVPGEPAPAAADAQPVPEPRTPSDQAGSTPPAPAGQAGSLASAQQAQCANEGFLTRFMCQERVRLAYCENLWNKHPDCMLENNATNY